MNWEKISESEYQLKQDGLIQASMKRIGGKAFCRIGNRSIQIRPKGFWSSQIELIEASGHILTTIKPVNWYGSRMYFRLYGQDYQLVVRNNPLVEYAVQQNGRDVVAYGLKTQDGRAVSVITDRRNNPLLELDLLLWYTFSAIAQGEAGDAETTDLDILILAV